MLNTLRFILSHPLNRGYPISALSRYAAWQIRSRLQHEVVIDWIEGTKLVARNGMTGATGNIYCGLHEYADMSFVLNMLRPGDLFVDVGANIGSYTVLASGVCGARSIAVEPDEQTVSCLQRNITENRLENLVEVHRTAVGASAGSVTFTVGKDTTNHVAKPGDSKTQIVPLARLDDVLKGKEPTCIKFDVEGYETEALLGAQETLYSPSLVAILLETVDERAQKILTSAGFQEIGYNPIKRHITITEFSMGSNRLFIKKPDLIKGRLNDSPRRSWRGREL